MIDQIRKPLFMVALALMVVTVLLELGSPVLMKVKMAVAETPGFGISYLALLDGLLLFTVGLIGAGFLIPERVQGRFQGILTLIITIVIFLLALVMIFAALMKLSIMLGLLFAPLFGPIAYLPLYGQFNTTAARVTLGLIMTFKLCFAGFLVFAHQRFLQNKGLVLIILSSLLATIIVSFLHGFLPVFLCSITDCIGAIVVAVIAVIWAIVFFVGSLTAVVKAVA
jgi:hypothetical protein